MKTVFERIIDGEIPSAKLYEDDEIIVILDINPVMKGHALVISKKVYVSFTEAPSSLLTHMFDIAKKIDEKQKTALSSEGTNIIINNGEASGQEIPHLHIHVIPRFKGDGKTARVEKEKYGEGEIDIFASKLSIT